MLPISARLRKEKERERDRNRGRSLSLARSSRQWLEAAAALQPRRILPCTAPLSSSSTSACIPENFQTCTHNPHSMSRLKKSTNLLCLIRVSVLFLDCGFNCLFSHPAQCLDAPSIEHCALSLSHACRYAHTRSPSLSQFFPPPPSIHLSLPFLTLAAWESDNYCICVRSCQR